MTDPVDGYFSVAGTTLKFLLSTTTMPSLPSRVAAISWLSIGSASISCIGTSMSLAVAAACSAFGIFTQRCFFTSSFRPEFYTTLGHEWVQNNGPVAKVESASGADGPVSPMKRVLQRTIPELTAELEPVINIFDPWARDRGEYYSLDWIPRAGAEDDVAFKP